MGTESESRSLYIGQVERLLSREVCALIPRPRFNVQCLYVVVIRAEAVLGHPYRCDAELHWWRNPRVVASDCRMSGWGITLAITSRGWTSSPLD